jgi:hypothetical protein
MAHSVQKVVARCEQAGGGNRDEEEEEEKEREGRIKKLGQLGKILDVRLTL